MHIKILRRLCLFVLSLLFVVAGASITLGDPPPWANDDKKDLPPVSAPEPTTLSLIGMGAAGVAGHYLVRKKRKK